MYLLGLIVLTSSCEGIFDARACTDAGCGSSFQLIFNAENDSLSIGNYSVLIEQEGGTQAICEFTLAQTGATCFDGDCIQNRSCDFSHLDAEPFFHDVYYSPDEEKVFLSYPMLQGQLEITVRQNNNLLTGLVVEPAYEVFHPNGPECSPTCYSASAELIINRE